MFAVTDFGTVFYKELTLRHGVQSASRELAVASFGTESCSPVGVTPTGNTLAAICATKATIQLSPKTDLRVAFALPDTGGYATGNRLRVCVEYPRSSISGFYQWALNGTTQVKEVVRIEHADAAGLNAVQETPLAGTDWSWCT